MSARRSMLTALGATTLLAVLWFVPSANATAPGHETGASGAPAAGLSAQSAGSAEVTVASESSGTSGASLGLADTGSVDTTPYVLGGTLCLGLGAGFVTFSVRRSRAL